jgi:bifunctional DNA-binding transcriptional regulator/antitoxin component of YhaV-PrlF toxin-antitoxin module
MRRTRRSQALSLEEEIPFLAEVIKGGRLTIPEEVRKLLKITEGNYVLCKLKVVARSRNNSSRKSASVSTNEHGRSA